MIMRQLGCVKNVFLLVLTLFVCSCQHYLIQRIEPIHSFEEVDFTSIEPETLVIFDVDETLIQPLDAYLINEHTPKAEEFKKHLFRKHPEVKDWNELTSLMLQQAQRPLLEPIIVEKIQELKRRNVLVIACTGMNIGSYGRFQSLEKWRYTHLKSLGFEGNYENLVLRLNGFKRNPGFYKGILSTDLESKGPAVGAFLDQIGLHPQKIVMFDDTLEGALLSVQKECEKRGILFQGYQYKGFKEKPWNESLIQFQAKHLIQYKKWLSDKEGDKRLKNLNSGST